MVSDQLFKPNSTRGHKGRMRVPVEDDGGDLVAELLRHGANRVVDVAVLVGVRGDPHEREATRDK